MIMISLAGLSFLFLAVVIASPFSAAISLNLTIGLWLVGVVFFSLVVLILASQESRPRLRLVYLAAVQMLAISLALSGFLMFW